MKARKDIVCRNDHPNLNGSVYSDSASSDPEDSQRQKYDLSCRSKYSDAALRTADNERTNERMVHEVKRMNLNGAITEHCLNLKAQEEHLPSVPGFVFDIDGVFKCGGQYASNGASVLRKLKEAHIPYVFMTNGGGGRTESDYAMEMNKKLYAFDQDHEGNKAYVTEDQVLLSYTPFETHLRELRNESVLVVGCPRAMKAAKQYGFHKAIHVSDYARKYSTLNPFGKSGCEKDNKVIGNEKGDWNENFKAVFVFTDPSDFFEALQIITDVLLSSRPGIVEYEPMHRIPLVFSNPDLLWKTQHPFPRFGQGAFRLSFEACYKARMNALGLSKQVIESRLRDIVQFGKPEHSQFFHARQKLIDCAKKQACRISHFYMVGDNPRSDITGALRMNVVSTGKKLEGWSGMLVRTGVWQDGEDPMGADGIYDNVQDIVDYVIKQHKVEIAELNSRCNSDG